VYLFPKATRGFEPVSYRGALLSTLLHATVYMFLQNLLNVLVQSFEPNSYRGVLLSTLLHATVYMFLQNLLNVLVQIANKMGLHTKETYCLLHSQITCYF
jgi:hypothetical protein